MLRRSYGIAAGGSFDRNRQNQWIKTTRAKTDTPVNVPLLKPAQLLLENFSGDETAKRETVFPYVSNQEVNRSLKIIAEICGIQKYLTFHLARHTFATTVTLMNGVRIETISKMLGHTKISTTMQYAKVTQTKIGMDMNMLQERLNTNRPAPALKAVKYSSAQASGFGRFYSLLMGNIIK
ncbi:site-specific integrase [Puia sp. P3]|uniref:site-specific integrase n=1 Tax=Puia sp. P3 TaxID=3423952 RepID=UPI003D6731AB